MGIISYRVFIWLSYSAQHDLILHIWIYSLTIIDAVICIEFYASDLSTNNSNCVYFGYIIFWLLDPASKMALMNG